MTNVRLETILPISPSGYLRARSTPEWRELHAKHMRHRRAEVLSERFDDTGLHEEVTRIVPEVDVPSLLRPFVCDGELAITETRLTPDAGDPPSLPHFSHFFSSNNLTDKVQVRGTIHVDTDHHFSGYTRLTLDVSLTVDFRHFIRPTVENAIIRSIKRGYDALPALVRDYLHRIGAHEEELNHEQLHLDESCSSAGTSESSFVSASSSLGSTSISSNTATTPMFHQNCGSNEGGHATGQSGMIRCRRLQFGRRQFPRSPQQLPAQHSCLSDALAALGWFILTICCCQCCGLLRSSASPKASCESTDEEQHQHLLRQSQDPA